jgi:5'-3' exonuclease
MGVPGIFLWLIKKYKNIISYNIDNDIKIDILYFDANCLVHPQTQNVLKKHLNWTNKFIEEKMLEEIENYIDYLVNFVKPTKMIYIAIDGVAPCAKIKHQRSRRYKSIKYRNQINAIKKKFNIKIDQKWDNASITPGTTFMAKLTYKLLNIINSNKYPNIQLIFSSSNTPGEGEHKILQHINKLKNGNKYNIVIYGLDADLIFLALASQKQNIWLLREVQHFGNQSITLKEKSSLLDIVIKDIEMHDDNEKDIEEHESVEEDVEEPVVEQVELNYLSIDILRDRLYLEITNKLQVNIKPKINDIINDFIFICYFIGNDFLPHIPSINIKNKGLEILINNYIKCLNMLNVDDEEININIDNPNYYTEDVHHLLEHTKINNIFLCYFLENVALGEEEYFRKLKNKNRRFMTMPTDKYELAVFKLDNLMFNIDDPVKLGKDNSELWKSRYYNHYFDEDKDSICIKYLEGLSWITHYYIDECKSWRWYYPYNNAPMISDLASFFKKNINYYDTLKFKLEEPVKPFVQLLTVLHPSCNHLLPHNLKNLMTDSKSPLIDLYPIKFEEDMLYKEMLWKCNPVLPHLDIDRIEQVYNDLNIKFNNQDIKRNNIIKPFHNKVFLVQ